MSVTNLTEYQLSHVNTCLSFFPIRCYDLTYALKGIYKILTICVPIAFLTTLRSNLHLSACPDSPYSSLVSTPTSAAFSSTALLAYPTPSPLSISASVTHYEQPPVSEASPTPVNAVITPDEEHYRAEALRLIADSVAEQRQSAAKAVLLHPYSVAVTVLLTGFLARYCSLRILFAISTTLIVVVLAVLYWVTREYPVLAANIDQEWLETPHRSRGTDNHNGNGNVNGNGNGNGNNIKKHSKCEDPIVLVSRLEEEVIGSLVLRVVKRERKAYVRAWAVQSSHRGKGVGAGLLQEAVKVAWGKGARCMEFEAAHANSYRALPPEFNRSFNEQEARAKILLKDLLAEHKREKSSR